jgi:hypothetical protein
MSRALASGRSSIAGRYVALLLGVVFAASGALACEKHLQGHQNSSDTGAESSRS